MRSLSTLAAAAACAVGFAPPAAAQKVVPIGIARSAHKSPPVHKRSTFTQTLNNNITGAGYYADVAVGTPPQNLTLILDTGSSDIWLLSQDAILCESSGEQQTYGYCLATCESPRILHCHERRCNPGLVNLAFSALSRQNQLPLLTFPVIV